MAGGGEEVDAFCHGGGFGGGMIFFLFLLVLVFFERGMGTYMLLSRLGGKEKRQEKIQGRKRGRQEKKCGMGAEYLLCFACLACLLCSLAFLSRVEKRTDV